MTKRLLMILMMGLAVCFAGCTDQSADEGGETAAPAGDAATESGAAEEPAAMQVAGDAAAVTLAKLDNAEVEAGCAKCAYKLADACALGMKVGDKTYIVEGTDIVSDDVGLCSDHRPAKVTGEARDDTHFVAAKWEFTDE